MKRFLFLFFPVLFPILLFSQNIKIDKTLGKEYAKSIEETSGLYDNQSMTTYLNKVGNRLVSNLENPLFEYHFNIVPDKSPNAFAIPGGYIYVTTGLIPILSSEDELACIIGHEIIHSNNRHSVQQFKRRILPKILEIPGNLLGLVNEDLGTIFNAPIKTSNELLFASYGRKFETEADDEGIRLSAKAGYDPNAMISALTKLSKAVEVATEKEEKKSYFSSHPYTPDRTKAIQNTISDIQFRKSKPVTNNFLYEFDQIIFGDDPNQGVIINNQFLHPDLNFFIEFPEKWELDNQESNIGAYHPDGEAGAFVFIENSKLNPKQAAMQFIENLDGKDRSKMLTQKVYRLNGENGYMLTFKEGVKSQTIFAYILWIPLKGNLYKLVGVGTEKYKKSLQNIAKSFRTLNKQDRDKIKIKKIKIVKAQTGETIRTLSKRVNNKLNLSLTSIINSKEIDEKLNKDTLIKVVIEEKYLQK